MKIRRFALTTLLLITAVAASIVMFIGYLHLVSHGD
jgi:hypothetical protein